MPITIVGNEFTIVWHERELLQVVKGVRRGMRERGMQPFEAATVFREFDTSSDGTLDLGEFKRRSRRWASTSHVHVCGRSSRSSIRTVTA